MPKVIFVIALAIMLSGCASEKAKRVGIGVLGVVGAFTPGLGGFAAGVGAAAAGDHVNKESQKEQTNEEQTEEEQNNE